MSRILLSAAIVILIQQPDMQAKQSYIRIPADKLNEFVDIVGELGNVTQENESVEDVTLQYVDVESHKKALETEQARLMELLSTAENMEDLLSIESKLSDIRYEIEKLRKST